MGERQRERQRERETKNALNQAKSRQRSFRTARQAGIRPLTTYFNIVENNRKTFFNFWEVGDVQKAAIFHLGRHAEVELSPELNVAGYKSHRVPSYYLEPEP